MRIKGLWWCLIMVKWVHMSEKSLVKTASKDILARAMAMEDITVEHRADAPSAYFDVQNRLLCLPVWKDMDDSVYDMLVGHEVSHALHTPADGWSEFVNKDGTRQMFLNIVEDARIERLIKDKFPGLKRDFASAYKTLNDQDLFELKGRTIDLDTPLIDRLNLEFKLGLFGLLDVPFTDEERPYVTRMAETKSFEDVMELAKELYERHQEEQEQEQQEAGSGSDSSVGAGEGDGDSESDAGESDEQSGETGSTGADSEDGDESGEDSASGSGDDGQDSGDSMEDDTDDGESAESTAGDSSSSDDSSQELSYEDYEANTGNSPAGSTQRAFEQGMENMRDENAYSTSYSTLPKMNLEQCVVDWKTIGNDLSAYYAKYENSQNEEFNASRGELQSFLNKSKPTVMHMVQQFQMKQAADAAKRTDVAKTGVLDTVGMINYRWSEDIFLKNEVHADGKSHGMVMYVDWSGSMSGILQDTVEQLIVLVEFCRKAGIPFDVYAFSSNQWYASEIGERYSDEWSTEMERLAEIQQYEKVTEDSLRPHTFQLFHYLSSDMNARQFKTALMNFWWVAQSAHSYRRVPSCYGLGCTPLNEAILCAIQQVPEFQAKHGIQVVNTVVLSDGEGHGIGMRGYHREQSYLRDHSTRKTYEVGSGQGAETDTLVRVLKDKTGCNAVSIRLHDAKNIKNLRWTFTDGSESGNQSFERACSEYRKQNFTTLPNASYDEYFIVKGNTEVSFDALEDLDDDASYTKLKNAFMKGNNNKKSSRVIANRIIDLIAS